MLDDWTKLLDEAKCLAVRLLLVDMSKAFDCMDHVKLVEKQIKMGINKNLIDLCTNFLKNRKQCVIYKNLKSTYLKTHIGIPQGTVLGPWLWLTFTNDLKTSAPLHKYADDLTIHQAIYEHNIESRIINGRMTNIIFKEDNNIIHKSAIELIRWCQNNNMSLSWKKTKTMILQNRNTNKIETEILVMEGNEINEVTSERILGITVDRNLNFIQHVDNTVLKCGRKLYWLRVLKKHGLDAHALKTLYISKIRSVLTYAAPAWYNYLSKFQKDRIERIQKLAIKLILPNEEYTTGLITLCIPTVDEFIKKLQLRIFKEAKSNKDHPLHARIPLE